MSVPTLEQEGLSFQVTAPDGLGGEIDRQSGLFTLNGTLRLAVEGDQNTTFQFELPMTTGQSGNITDAGEYSEVNSTFAEANLVSNEYAITDQTGDPIADDTLNIPSPDPSRNYAELGFEVDFAPYNRIPN